MDLESMGERGRQHILDGQPLRWEGGLKGADNPVAVWLVHDTFQNRLKLRERQRSFLRRTANDFDGPACRFVANGASKLTRRAPGQALDDRRLAGVAVAEDCDKGFHSR